MKIFNKEKKDKAQPWNRMVFNGLCAWLGNFIKFVLRRVA